MQAVKERGKQKGLLKKNKMLLEEVEKHYKGVSVAFA